MKRFLWLVIVVISGCSTTPNSSLQYSVTDISRAPAPVHNLRVGVSWFEDARPRANPTPSFDVGPASGQIHRGKIGGHLAIVLTKHLQHVNLFRETVFVGGSWTKKANAFDAQLTGTVTQFYSFNEYLSADKIGQVAGMFGGVLGGAVADQTLFKLNRRYVTEIQLADVRLVDSKTGKVLWSGVVNQRLEGTTTLQANSLEGHAPWKILLKQAMADLARQLQEAKIQRI